MATGTGSSVWRIGSWLVAGADAGVVGDALAEVDADAFALQAIRKEDFERVADHLALRHAWELSHHPVSRALPGTGVGLAVLTRHSVGDSASVVTNNHSSVWSRHRRVAHFAVVDRADGSSCTIGHTIGSPDPDSMGTPPAPLVWLRPTEVERDTKRAVDLPEGATLLEMDTHVPIAGRPPLLTVTFELPGTGRPLNA